MQFAVHCPASEHLQTKPWTKHLQTKHLQTKHLQTKHLRSRPEASAGRIQLYRLVLQRAATDGRAQALCTDRDH
jgi:hypothetical protein